MIQEDKKEIYKVLINTEEQYAFWPDFRKDIPLGWRETGQIGTQEQCAAYVKEMWTDMRPLSLRKQMEEQAQQSSENAECIHTMK